MYCYILFQCCSTNCEKLDHTYSWLDKLFKCSPSLELLPQTIVNKAGRGPTLGVCNTIRVFQI